MPYKADRAADLHRENMKKKRRELEQASLDTSDLLDNDNGATFAMVMCQINWVRVNVRGVKTNSTNHIRAPKRYKNSN